MHFLRGIYTAASVLFLNKLCIFGALIFLSPLTANAKSRCGSLSKSCSGYAQFCDDCPAQYYYLYLNQHACITGDSVTSESHSFSLSGALHAQNQVKLVGTLNNWVIWQTDDVLLAVPLDQKAGLFAKKNSKDDVGSIGLSNWHQLCVDDSLSSK